MSNMLGRPEENLLGIVEDFVTKLNNGAITPGQAKKFLRKEDPWTNSMDTKSQLNRWQEVYQNWFGIEIDLSSIKIPNPPIGFDRLIVVAKGLTMNQVVEVMRTKFKVSLYVEDLDGNVTKNDRINTDSYAIWVRDRVEADEENKNLSADDCTAKGIKGETLLERLLHELIYFTETGKHLDIKNWTLCSGSRHSDGGVPGVDWSSGGAVLRVCWRDPVLRHGSLRARAAVS